MLSLSPRYDMFQFLLPKDFLPKEIEMKYRDILNKTPGVISSPIDYLNESIKGINLPGITDLIIQQPQHSYNSIRRESNKINVEPKHDINHVSTSNPLDNIDKEFRITFRMNQGLYNYFMLFETIFYRVCKPLQYPPDPVFEINIMNDKSVVVSKIILTNIYINGIDGLEFDYSKVERDAGDFSITCRFDNIDFDFVTQ